MADPEKKYERYVAYDVAERVAARAKVKHVSGMQDWPVEVADFNRVSEFVRLYTSETWTDDERFALMQLILHSFNWGAYSTAEITSHSAWKTVVEILEREAELHACSILELGCVCNRDWTDQYFLAPLLQELYDSRLRDRLPL